MRRCIACQPCIQELRTGSAGATDQCDGLRAIANSLHNFLRGRTIWTNNLYRVRFLDSVVLTVSPLVWHAYCLHCGSFCRPACLQVARLPGGPDPGALQLHQPMLVPTQCIDQRADGKPISVTRAGRKTIGLCSQIPAQVLDLPLMGTDLPAPPDLFSNTFGAMEMSANRSTA